MRRRTRSRSTSTARAMWRRMLRPRTLIYTALLLAIIAATAASLYLRNPLKVDIIRDRGALAREAAPGVIENVYRLQIMNTDEKARQFTVSATGLPGLTVIGVPQPVVVGAAATRLLPFRLQVAADAEEGDDDHADRKQHDDKRPKSGSHKIDIVVQAIDDPAIVRREHASFLLSALSAAPGTMTTTLMQTSIDRARPWYREPWPWLLMAGPAIVVVAALVTAYLAVSSDDGVVADDYYKRGLVINRVLEREQRAAALGLGAVVAIGDDGARARRRCAGTGTRRRRSRSR